MNLIEFTVTPSARRQIKSTEVCRMYLIFMVSMQGSVRTQYVKNYNFLIGYCYGWHLGFKQSNPEYKE